MSVLYLVPLVPAIADWIAVARHERRMEQVFKPVTMVALIVVTALTWDGPYEGRFAATMVALALSLAGDVFLMQDRDMLLPGLAAFLGAHVAYIAAFGGPALSAYSVFIGTSLILITGPLFLVMRQALRRNERTKLIAPVFVYAIVISLMVLTALTAPGANEWNRGSIVAAAAGALLFYSSDAMIGVSRFVKEMRRFGPVAIMITYHVGQILLAYSLANA